MRPSNQEEGPTGELLLAFGVLNAILISGVLLRRGIKGLLFAWRDDLRLTWTHTVDRVLQGADVEEMAAPRRPWERAAAEATLAARWAASTAEQRETLRELFRLWGLMERRRADLRRGSVWRQAWAALLLGRFGCVEALPELLWLLRHGKAGAQLAAINGLHLMGSPEAVDGLVAHLKEEAHRHRRLVWAALIRCAQSQPWRLIPHLQQEQAAVRAVVAAALAETATAAETPALTAAASDRDPEVRAAVARALGRAVDGRALQPLRRLARDVVWFVRLQAVAALGRWSPAESRSLLLRATRDADWRVRAKAAAALVKVWPDAVALLKEVGSQGDRYALDAAVSALERRGVTWRAIAALASDDAAERAQSAALLHRLAQLKKTAALSYAAQKHPNGRVRLAVGHLLAKARQPAANSPEAAALGEARR